MITTLPAEEGSTERGKSESMALDGVKGGAGEETVANVGAEAPLTTCGAARDASRPTGIMPRNIRALATRTAPTPLAIA